MAAIAIYFTKFLCMVTPKFYDSNLMCLCLKCICAKYFKNYVLFWFLIIRLFCMQKIRKIKSHLQLHSYLLSLIIFLLLNLNLKIIRKKVLPFYFWEVTDCNSGLKFFFFLLLEALILCIEKLFSYTHTSWKLHVSPNLHCCLWLHFMFGTACFQSSMFLDFQLCSRLCLYVKETYVVNYDLQEYRYDWYAIYVHHVACYIIIYVLNVKQRGKFIYKMYSEGVKSSSTNCVHENMSKCMKLSVIVDC